MNWITTNIRFPEDLYLDLKVEAARRRTSVANVIRERISHKQSPVQKPNVAKIMREMNKFAAKMAQQNPGLDLSKALIKMRYEQ